MAVNDGGYDWARWSGGCIDATEMWRKEARRATHHETTRVARVGLDASFPGTARVASLHGDRGCLEAYQRSPGGWQLDPSQSLSQGWSHDKQTQARTSSGACF
jgi:hypothetical protein